MKIKFLTIITLFGVYRTWEFLRFKTKILNPSSSYFSVRQMFTSCRRIKSEFVAMACCQCLLSAHCARRWLSARPPSLHTMHVIYDQFTDRICLQQFADMVLYNVQYGNAKIILNVSICTTPISTKASYWGRHSTVRFTSSVFKWDLKTVTVGATPF